MLNVILLFLKRMLSDAPAVPFAIEVRGPGSRFAAEVKAAGIGHLLGTSFGGHRPPSDRTFSRDWVTGTLACKLRGPMKSRSDSKSCC